MKKPIAIMMAALLIAAFMTACGAPAAPATPAAPAAPAAPAEAAPAPAEAASAAEPAAANSDSILRGKKISFLTSQAKFFEEYNAMADAMLEKYGCTVEFQVVPDNEFTPMVKMKLSTSEVPDVFEYNYPTQNLDLGAAQYCVDLSNEPWVSRLVNPSLIADPNDGKVYAMPKEGSASGTAVYYNKKILADAGITDPHPTTYQQFLDILTTLKGVEGVTPLYMTNGDTWTTQIYITNGIPVALGDDDAATFEKLLKNQMTWSDLTVAQQQLQNYVDLITNGFVNDDHLSAKYDSAAEILGTGKAAMYLTIDEWAVDMANKYPELEIGSFIIPYGDKEVHSTGAYVQGLFVPNAGAQVDVAKAFLEAWSSPEIQNIYYKTVPGFPAFNDVDGGEVNPAVKNIYDQYITTAKYTIQLNDQMSFVSPLWPTLWDYYVEACAGTKSVAEVFSTFQNDYVDYMQQQGVEGY